MMDIVCAIYHDCNKEARSMEMLQCMKLIGSVHYVSYAAPNDKQDIKVHLIDKSKKTALFDFIACAKKVIYSVKPQIVFLHDNDCSVLIPYIKRVLPEAMIIYDSSELYIDDKESIRKALSNGLGIYIKQLLSSFRKKYEKKYLHLADIVIAANRERAEKMVEYYNLRVSPIVFDNIHKIDDDYNLEECKEKFGTVIVPNTFNILFGGGINEERKTFDFIESFCKLEPGYNLILVGSASRTARKKYERLLRKYNLKNVHYVGFVSRAELRYLFQHCQASVVIFDKDSFNTLYCASGKCYESLFEGTPIITSENPPLKRICNEEKVGVSNDNYVDAIHMIKENYSFYSESTRQYIIKLDYDNRIVKLKEQLMDRYIER